MIKKIVNDEELIEFIIKNRTIKIVNNDYDIITGKTATGYCSKLFKNIRNGNVSLGNEEIAKRILKDSYSEQICIKTEKGLKSLTLKQVHYYAKEDFI